MDAALGRFFALASAVIWALAVILLRRSGETLPALELNLFKIVLSLLLVLGTIGIVGSGSVPTYAPREWWLIFWSGFLGIAVADTLYLHALNTRGASRTGIVSASYTPFVIILSAVFLGERLGPWQWTGFALVMAGILLVTWRRARLEVDAAAVRQGTLYAASAMAAMAAGIVMVKEILETRPFLWTVELRMASGLLGMVLYISLKRRWAAVLARFCQPQPWALVVTASFLAAYVGILFWLAGYKLIPASEAAILNETNSAFIVLFAWLMLGEPLTRRKLTGLTLTLVGVLIMLVL